MSNNTRKRQHIRICLEEDIEFRKSNGFERYEFEYNALSEIGLPDIDLSTGFLGHPFKAPFFIEAMTGGAEGTETINRNLGRAAQTLSIGLGLGSQRTMLENPEFAYTYLIRDCAPDIFLLGNLGGSRLLEHEPEEVLSLAEAVGADGMAIHLNPLHELVQPEGDLNWVNVHTALTKLCQKATIPIVVKEVGSGLSGKTARQLEAAGVSALDVAGAGGSSFARVEHYRGSESAAAFFEWGIPTAESLKECRAAVDLPLIASGGIRNGVECAKALAMGADLVGFALPLLKPALESAEAVIRVIERMTMELKKAMMLLGVSNIEELKKCQLASSRPAHHMENNERS